LHFDLYYILIYYFSFVFTDCPFQCLYETLNIYFLPCYLWLPFFLNSIYMVFLYIYVTECFTTSYHNFKMLHPRSFWTENVISTTSMILSRVSWDDLNATNTLQLQQMFKMSSFIFNTHYCPCNTTKNVSANDMCGHVDSATNYAKKKQKTPWLVVRKWTIPTERPPLVGEVSANFFR
jgi:hypothetical protein